MSVLQLQTGHYDPTRSEEVVKKINQLIEWCMYYVAIRHLSRDSIHAFLDYEKKAIAISNSILNSFVSNLYWGNYHGWVIK